MDRKLHSRAKEITAIFLLLFLLSHVSCRRQQASNSLDRPVAKQPDQEGWNSMVTSTNKGRVEAIVHYGHMTRFSEDRMAFFDQGVKVEFYNEAGRRQSVLTAQQGELHEANNDILARGRVQVVSDTLTLWTEELRYEQASEKIRSNEKIKFVTLSGDTLFGSGFESDSRLRNYRIVNLAGVAHRRVDLSLERLARRDSAKVQQK
jgi:LPS export ABC transporter protein LptC